MSIIPNLVISGALASYTLLETLTFEVEEKTISHPQIPDNFSGVRIVFLSDIHHGVFLRRPILKKIVDKIIYLEPHLVLLGGDYVQSKLPHHRQLEYLDNVFSEIKRIKAPLGKFGVLGNHDHDEVGAAATARAMRAGGCRPLDNQAVWIWKGFQRIRLGGVGDLWLDQQDLEPTLKSLKPSDYTILLSHQPLYIDQADHSQIDLMLTGHTHGGQALPLTNNVPFNLGQMRRDRIKGWVQVDHTQLLISRGLGVEFPFIRLFNQPQIHLLTLQKSPTNQVI